MGRELATIPRGLIGHEENGKTSLLTYNAIGRPDRKKYVVGREVLFVKAPADLPIFFRKVGTLALWSRLNTARARKLLRAAVIKVGQGEAMSYRLRPKEVDCLTRLGEPRGIEQWVAVEARTIVRTLRKEVA